MAENPMDAWMSFQKSWMETMGRGMPTGGGKPDGAGGAPDPFEMWRGLWQNPGAGKWQDLTGMQHVLSTFGAYARLFDAWRRTTGPATICGWKCA